jgi:putative DNA primase/helicase
MSNCSFTLQQIARALGGEISGGQVLAPGPNHSAEDRSLAVKPGEKGLVVFSHAGDDIRICKDHVREGLGLPPWNGKAKANGPIGAIVAEYDYRDETGKLLFQVVRFAPKKFAQRRPNGNGGWSWSLGDARRVLYRLPEIGAAIANEHAIFIAEGEKAVEALVKLGVPATCSPHGAGKWRHEFSQFLKGAIDALKANGPDPGQSPSGLIIVRASDVTPVAVDWIWDGRIARGKITIIAGLPDVGKSQIGAHIAARITKGEHWPNGARAPQGDVVILASEDGIEDTWVPRLMAAGADLTRVHFIKMVIDKHGKRRSFNLQEDLEVLGEKLNVLQKPQLLVVDPITSYLGKVDAHRTPDVRAVMDPIGDFAERSGIGVFAVTHPPKSQVTAMNAFTGSMAFVAGARIAFIVVPEPETQRHLMLAVKNNVGQKAQGRGYIIEGKTAAPGIIAPRIIWDDAPVDMTADQALAAINRHNKDGGSLTEAKDFLRELLAKGPIPAKEAEEAAEANGVSERTLRRARKELGIKTSKSSFDAGWTWSMEA